MSEDARAEAIERFDYAIEAAMRARADAHGECDTQGILSEEWLEMAQAVRAALLDSGKCETCGSLDGWLVHHDESGCGNPPERERCPAGCTDGTRAPLAYLAGDFNEAVAVLERVRDAYSFLPAIHKAADGYTVEDVRHEAEEMLDYFVPAVNAFLARLPTPTPVQSSPNLDSESPNPSFGPTPVQSTEGETQ